MAIATMTTAYDWFWFDDKNWVPYAESVNEEINAAFLRGDSSVSVDAEREIQFASMLQLRKDDPSRQVCFFERFKIVFNFVVAERCETRAASRRERSKPIDERCV